MRKYGNDRSRFPKYPPVNSRRFERLTDEDSVLETRLVDGFVFPVYGLPNYDLIVASPNNFTYFVDSSGNGSFV